MKWLWITLGAIVGTPLVYHYGYLLWSSFLIPVTGDEDMILRAIFFAITVMVICTAIIVNKLNKLRK